MMDIIKNKETSPQPSAPPIEDHLCIICYEQYRVYVLQDCMHLISCEACIDKLQICPLCRKEIKVNPLRIYV